MPQEPCKKCGSRCLPPAQAELSSIFQWSEFFIDALNVFQRTSGVSTVEPSSEESSLDLENFTMVRMNNFIKGGTRTIDSN